MSVREISTENEYQGFISNSGAKLVVVDFYATWCGPCKMIAGPFENLSKKYARGAIFLKVDVDKHASIAQSENVTSMPTFKIYRSRSLLGTVNGANIMEIENIILKYYKDVSSFQGEGNKLGQENASSSNSSYGVTNFIYSLFGGSTNTDINTNETSNNNENEEEEELLSEEPFVPVECNLQIRLWDRTIIKEKLQSDDKLEKVAEIIKNIKGAPDQFFISTLMPRRVFKQKELKYSLNKLNLVGNIQLVILLNQ